MKRDTVYIGRMPYKRNPYRVGPVRDYIRELPNGAVVRVVHASSLAKDLMHIESGNGATARMNGAKWFAFYYSRFSHFPRQDCFEASSTIGAHSAIRALRRGMIGRVNEI